MDPWIAVPMNTASTTENLLFCKFFVLRRKSFIQVSTHVAVARKMSNLLAELKTAIVNANAAVKAAVTPIRWLTVDS